LSGRQQPTTEAEAASALCSWTLGGLGLDLSQPFAQRPFLVSCHSAVVTDKKQITDEARPEFLSNIFLVFLGSNLSN
jgi:hypothetical protein